MHRFTEVVKLLNGEFYNVERHNARMQNTIKYFYGKDSYFDISHIDIPQEYRKGLVKCRMVYNYTVLSISFEAYSIRPINSVMLVDGVDVNYEYKYENRSQLNELFNLRQGCDDVLITKNRAVTDLSFANLVFEDWSGELYTPSTPLLSGTKRDLLLADGIINERHITIDDLDSYRGFYVINAMIDLEDQVFIPTTNIAVRI